MTRIDDRLRRARADLPMPAEGFEEKLVNSALAAHAGAGRPSPARRRMSGSVRLMAAAAALVGAGGIAFAAITLPKAPPEIGEPVRAALALPSFEVEQLRPLPGGIREVLSGENEAGTWHLYTIETEGRGTLVTYGLRAQGVPTVAPGSSIGGCATLGEDAIGTPCARGHGPFLPGQAPAGTITGMEGGPAYATYIGRASDHVTSIELVRPDGAVVTGWVANGYYLIVDLDGSPLAGQVRALDDTGRAIAAEPVRGG